MGRPQRQTEHPRLYTESAATVLTSTAADRVSDRELVERAADGDHWAFEALFRRHVSSVMGTIVRILRRRDEACDIVQETFISAFSSLATLRDPDAICGWLRLIAVRHAYRALKKRRFLQWVGLDHDHEDDMPLAALMDPSASPEVRTELALLDSVIVTLPPKERVAWMLRYVDGESLEEIARIIGCSLATAKRRIKGAEERIEAHTRGRNG